jgi:hypothetical protein
MRVSGAVRLKKGESKVWFLQNPVGLYSWYADLHTSNDKYNNNKQEATHMQSMPMH